MKKYNCIAIYDKTQKRYLFCRRRKPPYKGLFNFVGGKIETSESGIEAAYRELYEETGISKEKVKLEHLMDIVYYKKDMMLEIYFGTICRTINLVEECQKLFWFDENTDFFGSCFAGEGNIGHIIRQIEML